MTNNGTLELDGTGDSRYFLQPGMERSAAESFDKLAELLEKT